MTRWLALAALTFRVAFRNLWLYRLRTVVIGSVLGLGAFLAVVGLTLLGDVEASMRASVTESVAGDLQVYSDKAKDELAIFGGSFMGRADSGTLPDFVPYRDAALAHPNVEAVIPMGLDMAILGRGNELDDALDALRAALKAGDAAIIGERIEQLRFQEAQLARELAERRKLSADQAELDRQSADLAKAQEPAFLAAVAKGDEPSLQVLETKIAPLSGEKQPIYLNYLGTDVELFRANFAKFRMVEGDVLPQGRRGLMLSHKVREEMLKNIVARLFDRLKKRAVKDRVKIAGDPENERDAADLKRQYAQVLAYLDRHAAEELSGKLTALGLTGAGPGGTELVARLTRQLQDFLTVDDENLLERHAWFYANIAPRIRLYEISPGETVTVRSYTRSGYVKNVPLKVYGVFTFDGLEDSDLAGALNIVDLISFRELYGQMTEESRSELAAMRQQVGLKEVKAEDAEAALFGDAAAPHVATRPEPAAAAPGGPLKVKPAVQDLFDPAEVRRGLAISTAIKLKDPAKQAETMRELEASFKDKGLGVRVIDWQKASGIVGQLVNVIGMALVFALLVIFLVALVIINNTIIVGTLNRIREIGTMRAIGGQKSFVVGLFLAETGVTGLVGAVLGTAAAVAALEALHKVGLPAGSDFVSFLFSGPRLYPTLRWPLVLAAPPIVTAVATLTTVYAARHAARVRPAEAMQEAE